MRTLAALLIVAAALPADEIVASFRIKSEPRTPMRGYLADWNDADFRFRAFGVAGRRRTIRWDQLVVEDAGRLRRDLGLELSEDEKLGVIDGDRLYFHGGATEEGLLVRVDEDGTHWLKVPGLILPYPAKRIRWIEKFKIDEDRVYTPEEIYLRDLESRPLGSARDHLLLADRMYDVGNFKRAREHYNEAMAKDTSLTTRLEGRLAELKELERNAALAKAAGKARRHAFVDGDYARAERVMERFISEHPDMGRSAQRTLGEIRKRRQARVQKRFLHVKHRALDFTIRRHAQKGKLDDIDAAMDWVLSALPGLLKDLVCETMNLSDEEYDALLEDKGKGAPHHAGYWSGSFVVKNRGVKTTGAGKTADRHSWWDAYESQTKTNFLKAFSAERLPEIFDVIAVRHTDCVRCGGRGKVKKLNLMPRGGQKSEWWETCPRCWGARRDRSVSYR